MIPCLQTHQLQTLDNILLPSFTQKHLYTSRFWSISDVHYNDKEKRLASAGYLYIQMPRKSSVNIGCLNARNTPFIKAMVTLEPKFQCEGGPKTDCDLESNTSLELDSLQSHGNETHEISQQERLRRAKISKANKGNVPWNKGKKYSAEIIQRIRERTKLAMQDPKVKNKIRNFGRTQSEETRQKISMGMHLHWERQRRWLAAQEKCLLEWRNMIAEASRKGYTGEDELQWDSYKILDKKLENEWLESIERRKSTQRTEGSNSAPKPLEQCERISEAISAKWEDPEYRRRVYEGISKYYSIRARAERRSRRMTTGEKSMLKSVLAVKRATVQQKSAVNVIRNIEREALIQKRDTIPTWKNPPADSKQDIIKKNAGANGIHGKNKKGSHRKDKVTEAEGGKADLPKL